MTAPRPLNFSRICESWDILFAVIATVAVAVAAVCASLEILAASAAILRRVACWDVGLSDAITRSNKGSGFSVVLTGMMVVDESLDDRT